MVKQAQEQKQKAQGGFFGFFRSSSNKEDQLLSSEDVQNIESFVKDNLSDEALKMSAIRRPEDYVWFTLSNEIMLKPFGGGGGRWEFFWFGRRRPFALFCFDARAALSPSGSVNPVRLSNRRILVPLRFC